MSTIKYSALIRCTNCESTDCFSDSEKFIKCGRCGSSFRKVNSTICFVESVVESVVESSDDAKFQQIEMLGQSIFSKVYNFSKRIVNVNYIPNDQIKDLIKLFNKDVIAVELGSGARRLSENIINVDLYQFSNVDFTMDVHYTAFRDEVIDYIIMDSVLEHVKEPQKVIDEAFRILKPNGTVICSAPWIFPYHGYPNNYFNISSDGHHFMFRKFSKLEVSMRHGPTSALINLISEYFAYLLAGRNKFLYVAFKGVILLPIFWLKYLDYFWQSNYSATRISSSLCVKAVK